MGVAYDGIIIHYSEVFLKGAPVKHKFEQLLISRIQEKLKWRNRSDLKVSLIDHTLCIKGAVDVALVAYLAQTFGVRYAMPVIFCKSSITSIREASSRLKEIVGDDIPLSYRIKPKKEKGLSLSSKTIEYEVSQFFGHWLLNLSKPSSHIYAVIKKQYAYIGYKRIDGPGGLPYGASGKVLALVSKGIDSSVAAWLMAKRGCEISLLHFGDDSIKKISTLLEQYSGKPIKVYTLSHHELLQQFKDHQADKYLCILCKIAMYLAGELIARKIRAQAIITGENLGQVASQTLENMVSMTSMVEVTILRPLIAFNKEEIINLAKEIGSYSLYQNPSCPFVPNHPSTSIKKEKLKHYIQSSVFLKCVEDWSNKWQAHIKL